jgi:hypothetical protein
MAELFLSPPRPVNMPDIPQDRPVFRILDEKGFFGPDDTLYSAGALVVLYDEPSVDMEPLNDLAQTAFNTMLDKLEAGAREVAKKSGKMFIGTPRTKEEMINGASDAARSSASIMGEKKTSKSVKHRIDAVEPGATPEMGDTKKKVETLQAAPKRI